jgi:hypothetical protein
MNPLQSCFYRLLLGAVLVAIAGTGGRACAQDDEENEEKTQANAREARALAFRAWVNNWTASRLGIQGVRFRDFLETLLLRRINHLAADGHLTDAQLTKLKLAGRADIKRFMDRLDQVAGNFELAQVDGNDRLRASLELQAAWDDVHAGFFVKNSLFFKALTRMLSSEPAGEQVTIVFERSKGAEGRSGTKMEDLDAEAQLARTELMRLTYSVASKQDFDRWAERELKSGVERREHLITLLSNQLVELLGDCNLTTAQFEKLELAGRDDITGFLERLEEFERRFASPFSFVKDFPGREAESLKRFYLSDFGVDSCFSRTLATTLSEEQRVLREERLGERNLVRYQSAIHEAARSLAKAVRMNEAQCRMFEELLQKETRAPRRFGRFSQSEPGFGGSDSEVVLVQAARISDDKLNAALGLSMCDKLSRRLSRWSGMDSEKWLTSHGFILEEGPSSARPDRAEVETKTEKR